jgi:DNA polymerase-3 subunit beta
LVSAFNPSFLLDGLTALGSPATRLLFTSGSKPVVVRPAGGEPTDYTYLIQPVRLPG